MASESLNADFPAFPRLPAIPSMRGEEDFEVWHDALLLQMSYFDVHDIITGDEQAPAKTASREDQKRFKRKQVLAYTMLSNSIQPIIAKLQALGYNDEKHVLDSRNLYNAVIRWDSEISAEHKFRLVKELTDIDHSQFPNLHAFLDRALWLRRRLKRALFNVSDELMGMLLLKGISSYDDAWTKMVLHGKTTGSLVEDIASLIAKKATEQEAMSATSSTTFAKDTQEKGTQATYTKATEEKGTQVTCRKATQEKGIQATCRKSTQEKGIQAEPIQNQNYNEAPITNIHRPDTPNTWIPSAADETSKNVKPSDLIATPNGVSQSTIKVGSQSITATETLKNGKTSTMASTSNSTPQSETDARSKSPNTNATTPSPTPNGAWQIGIKAANSTAAHDTNSGVTKPSNAQPSATISNTDHQTDINPQQPGGFGFTGNGSPQDGPHFVNPPNAVLDHILNRKKDVHAWLLGNSWASTEKNSWTSAENPHAQIDQNSPSQRAASVQHPPHTSQDQFGPESFASYLIARDNINNLTQDGKPRLRIKRRPYGPEDPRHW